MKYHMAPKIRKLCSLTSKTLIDKYREYAGFRKSPINAKTNGWIFDEEDVYIISYFPHKLIYKGK